MEYETRKHSGDYPIIGVNTFLKEGGGNTPVKGEVMRATEVEKKQQVQTVTTLHQVHASRSAIALEKLRSAAVAGENLFDVLMEVCKYCSLGQITRALFEIGGEYRRNM